MVTILVVIGGYYINGYCIWSYFIGGYWWLLMVIIVVDIDKYFIGGY